MVNPSDFRNGMTIEWEGELWVVIEFQQGQNARGDTFFRTKLRNVRSGSIIDQKFRDKDRFARARIEKVPCSTFTTVVIAISSLISPSTIRLPLNMTHLGE